MIRHFTGNNYTHKTELFTYFFELECYYKFEWSDQCIYFAIMCMFFFRLILTFSKNFDFTK